MDNVVLLMVDSGVWASKPPKTFCHLERTGSIVSLKPIPFSDRTSRIRPPLWLLTFTVAAVDSSVSLPGPPSSNGAKVNFTLYGNAINLSGENDPYVTSVTQEGSLDAGYGLLKLRTKRAGTDLCFAAYRPGAYQTGALETDAVQAMVVTDGQAIRAMYLGGGRMLKAGGSATNSLPRGASIERNEPGLAYVERLANGVFVVGNPSPTDATVTVILPALRPAPRGSKPEAKRRSAPQANK